MLVYATHTGTRDITERMEQFLSQHGFKVAVLKADAVGPAGVTLTSSSAGRPRRSIVEDRGRRVAEAQVKVKSSIPSGGLKNARKLP